MTQCRWRPILNLFVLLVLAIAPARGTDIASCDGSVRVGLVRTLRNVKQITLLASSSDYVVTRTGSKDKLATCGNFEPITLSAGQSQISLRLAKGSASDVGASVTIAPSDGAGVLSLDSPGKPSKQYRGVLEVTLKSGCLQLVNTVSIEDYLPGVVTGEMPSSYPDEALKAQAVAARTYTLCTVHRHSASGYDLCDDAHCQVYDGVLHEQPSTTRSVLATKGLVLTYKGRLASIMYCADCGGVTECYGEAHDHAIPYMPSVIEPAGITHRPWERSYKVTELSAKLVAAGVKGAEGLQNICISKTSSSGRGLVFDITGTKGSASISGIKLRAALGRDGIRSTLCTIDVTTEGVITFKGKGWGHGIGLCQVGAGALASPPFGYTYGQILAHYYPGTVLSTLPLSVDQGDAPAEWGPKDQPSDVKQTEAPKSRGTIEVKVEAPKL